MGLQELFVETIAKDAYCCAQQGKRKTLQRRDLDNAIEAVDEFAFLEGNNMSPSPEAEQMPAPCSWTSKTDAFLSWSLSSSHVDDYSALWIGIPCFICLHPIYPPATLQPE
ncbi:DNA polymerase epsilon subunit 4 isoform X4 [Lepus europaeus]|uniref:DNA polymerase epsilon subunit 4 isoform X4 n=1 Tax=Lepus europaeus TaxID=9983 RepID=UPI002B4645B0|nr:DNA polymerase epsilon subunit 4 isoform X4 [Lepus europaeus]